MLSPKMIKTSCGIDKYQQLKKDKSVGKLRLTWFVAIATLRDLTNRKIQSCCQKIIKKLTK